MAYFAMGDLHLSGNPPKKPMDVFGSHWENHHLKILANWQETITEKDTVFLVGDFSWAMRLNEAKEDLDSIIALPGRKILIRGNHDYWWSSQNKMKTLTENKLIFLQANAIALDNCLVGGSRGYMCPGDQNYNAEKDDSIYRRELLRVEMALEEMTKLPQTGPKILLLHYPPFNEKHEASGFTDLLEKYDVDHCIYGHLHSFSENNVLPTKWKNTQLHLVSSNFLDFKFKKIL